MIAEQRLLDIIDVVYSRKHWWVPFARTYRVGVPAEETCRRLIRDALEALGHGIASDQIHAEIDRRTTAYFEEQAAWELNPS